MLGCFKLNLEKMPDIKSNPIEIRSYIYDCPTVTTKA